MNIELETLSLIKYNKDKYKELTDELDKGESSSKYIHQIKERLELSNYNNIYQNAYIVLDKDIPIGYLYISSMINDEVYLEYSILKQYRHMGYASDLLYEITNYLFENNNIKNIKLDIDPSNKGSILVAISNGYNLDEEDYEKRNYLGKMKFIKESDCYISKRRK